MPRPKPSEIIRLLKPNPDLAEQKPGDTIPGAQPEPNVGDKDTLSQHLQKTLRECIRQREDFGFQEKMAYNEKSYYGIKDEFFSHWPWENASNFKEPITPTFVDVGRTQIQAVMFRNQAKTVLVRGFGKEDKPYAPLVAHVMNWENAAENEFYDVQSLNVFRVLKDGTGFVKTWLDVGDEFRVRHASIPMRLIYKPIRGNGCQRDKAPYYHQLIPLNEWEWKFRQGLTIGGKKVYENLDLLTPGFEPTESLAQEEMLLLQNQITGMDVEGAEQRDMRYLVETPMTYYPPGQFRAKEIVVWWSPRLGLIHRVIELDAKHERKVRGLADYWVYLSDGYAYQRSLPEILRDIQEKADYTDKQTTDAADVAINPPGYVDKQSDFAKGSFLRAPTGLYEVEKGTKITFETRDISAIIERGRHLDKLWDKAKIRSGFTDIFLGVEGERATTLGGDRIRLGKAETRFQDVLNTFGIGWRRTCEIQYELTNRAVPRKKLIQILGSADFTNVNQLFPNNPESDVGMGLADRKFNFGFAQKSQVEQEQEDFDALETTKEILLSPFGQSKAVAYKCLRKRAEIRGFAEFDVILSRPPEADVFSVEEVLQRIESNEVEVFPSPLTDRMTAEYQLFRFQAFMRSSDRFKEYSQRQKIVLIRYINRLDSILKTVILADAEKRAETDPAMALALDSLATDVAGGNIPIQ